MKNLNKVLLVIAVLSLLLLTACGTKEKQDEFKQVQNDISIIGSNVDLGSEYFLAGDYDNSDIYFADAILLYQNAYSNVEKLSKDYDMTTDKKIVGAVGTVIVAKMKIIEASKLFNKPCELCSTTEVGSRAAIMVNKYKECKTTLEGSLKELETLTEEDKVYIETYYNYDTKELIELMRRTTISCDKMQISSQNLVDAVEKLSQ